MVIKADITRGPFDPGGQPDSSSRNALQLGLFAWNLTGGATASKAILSDPERLQNFWHWDNARDLVQQADRIGFEFELPFARWIGHGGPTRFNEDSLDFVSTAAALAPITEQTMLMSTAHITYGYHPMHFAKIGASIDYMSKGRWGLNVVCGWFEDEQLMFGQNELDHEKRYDIADEFVTLLKWLWSSDEPVDFEGDYYKCYGGRVSPKPARSPRPIIVNAGQSPTGIDFAARHCEWAFCNASPKGTLEQIATYGKAIRERADHHNRVVRPITFAYVIMADTDQEAKDIADWVKEEVDEEAADTFIARATGKVGNMGWAGAAGEDADASGGSSLRQELGEDAYMSMALGLGGYHIFGSPETVAEQFKAMHDDCGMDGVLLSFFDPQRGLHQTEDQLIPILRKMGLRA